MTASPNTSSFYDSIAHAYDTQLTAQPADARVRSAFHELVGKTVNPGGLLLDFGCGTGTDALAYVRRGYRVLAYDNSPGMIGQLKRKCGPEIIEGKIDVIECGYESFLKDSGRWPRPQAVVSDFAVINSIPDLQPLFRAISGLLEPGEHFIISALNPFFWRDLLDSDYWRPCWKSLSSGAVEFQGPLAPSWRHCPGRILAAGRADFFAVKQSGRFRRYLFFVFQKKA